jgi:transcriptional regulator with XRE-family HTH domain
MKKRIVRNRLLELVTERERRLGRRMRLRDIAEFVGITDNTITSWIRNEVTRFDSNVIEGFCNYFEIDLADLLYFEWIEDESESQADTAKKNDD